MNRFPFSAFFAVSAITGILSNTEGQTINPTVQTASPRVATTRGAPATAAKPVAPGRPAPQVAPRPTGINSQRFNSNLPRTIAQAPINPQRSYSPPLQTSNPALAALNLQRNGAPQQPIAVDSATRQTELRTLAAMHQRRGVVTREGNILEPAADQNEIRTLPTMRERRVVGPEQANMPDSATGDTELRSLETLHQPRAFGPKNHTVATIDPQRHVKNRNPEAGPQPEKPEGSKDVHGKKWHNRKDHVSFDEASRRHWHERHDRNWWHDHCDTIVFVTTGYYFLDGSYWYPAYGYDPLQTYYDYDGPVYTYSNLLPDEVIANVQTALQDAGYYYGEITGSLSVDTRAAIANFQRDYGLQITGAIDEATVESLGLY